MAPAVSAGVQHGARVRIAFVLADSLGVIHIADVSLSILFFFLFLFSLSLSPYIAMSRT